MVSGVELRRTYIHEEFSFSFGGRQGKGCEGTTAVLDSAHAHPGKPACTTVMSINARLRITTGMMSDTLQPDSYLGDVDASLLERAVVGVLGAHVAILAPVTREGAVHTGEAAGREKSWLKRRPITHHPL